MNKGTKIALVIGGVLVVGVGGYFAYKKFFGGATKEQLDEFVKATKDSGSDMFDDITPQRLEIWWKGFKTLTKEEADKIIELANKKPPTPSDALEYTKLLNKVTQEVKGS